MAPARPLQIIGAAALLILVACNGDESESDDGSGGGSGACRAGELLLADGSCVSAGIPADACGEGFVPNDNTCDPVLPNVPCAPGEIAVAGDAGCRPLDSCGMGPYGDIPTNSVTEYVDKFFIGTSDGTASRPWRTIEEAVEVAQFGGLVAISAGEYREQLDIVDKSIRIWGRCASMVTVRGFSARDGEPVIHLNGAGGPSSEIVQLTVTGADGGIQVTDAAGVMIDRVWLRDTGDYGVRVIDDLDHAVVSIRDSLLEGVGEIGALAVASELNLEGSVVRQSLDGPLSVGVQVEAHPDTQAAGAVLLSRSVVEGHLVAGVHARGGVAVIDDSVIRNGLPAADGGRGVTAIPRFDAEAVVSLRRSIVLGNVHGGVVVGGTKLSLEHSTVRDTLSGPDGQGSGVVARAEGDIFSSLVLTSSVVERSVGVGILSAGALVTANGMLIRDTAPGTGLGDGLLVVSEPVQAEATMNDGRIERSGRAGVSSFGAMVSVSSTAFECNATDLASEAYNGMSLQVDVAASNRCACGQDTQACEATSAGLTLPDPL